MKTKITKGMAFLLSLFVIFLMFAATSAVATISWFMLDPMYRKTELLLPYIGTFLTAIATITGGFLGFNVADNGVKGKFFNAGLTEGVTKEQ